MESQMENAIVLHRRPFRETSLLVEFLTENHGRVAVVARGARKSKSRAGLLQPFQKLLISWKGKGDLATLTQVESLNWKVDLKGTELYCGLYLNELLIRCLQRHHTQEHLFELYTETLASFSEFSEAQALRTFEWNLLSILGYRINLETDHQADKISEKIHYLFDAELGFIPTEPSHLAGISGEELLKLSGENWHNPTTLKVARYITRLALQPLVGNKPFASRELYSQLKKQQLKKQQLKKQQLKKQ